MIYLQLSGGGDLQAKHFTNFNYPRYNAAAPDSFGMRYPVFFCFSTKVKQFFGCQIT